VTIRVLIADDQELVRTGFRMILTAAGDIEVAGEASNGLQAVSLARSLSPDVVLMDVRMPELDGIAAAGEILARGGAAAPRVLMLTTFDLDEYVYDSLRAGASGFLLKDLPAAQLVAGVRTVAEGEALLAPAITRRLIEEFAAPPADPPAGLQQLTARELEVLRYVAKGLSNAEIAAELIIGEATVKTHVTRMLTKLGLRDRVQAVVLAYEAGIVTPATRAVQRHLGTSSP
jgi:DNA-binding NarL/FixJ family response regulator